MWLSTDRASWHRLPREQGGGGFCEVRRASLEALPVTVARLVAALTIDQSLDARPRDTRQEHAIRPCNFSSLPVSHLAAVDPIWRIKC